MPAARVKYLDLELELTMNSACCTVQIHIHIQLHSGCLGCFWLLCSITAVPRDMPDRSVRDEAAIEDPQVTPTPSPQSRSHVHRRMDRDMQIGKVDRQAR
jgi:hypothetical protein